MVTASVLLGTKSDNRVSAMACLPQPSYGRTMDPPQNLRPVSVAAQWPCKKAMSQITSSRSSELQYCSRAVQQARPQVTEPEIEEILVKSKANIDHSPSTSEQTEKESLQVLEWPALCRQVAAFASTPMAARSILLSGLPMGRSKVFLI